MTKFKFYWWLAVAAKGISLVTRRPAQEQIMPTTAAESDPSIKDSVEDKGDEDPMYRQIEQALQCRVWADIMRSVAALNEDERDAIMQRFIDTFDSDEINWKDMFNFFDSLSMKYSKIYYFIKGVDQNANWDKALKELS